MAQHRFHCLRSSPRGPLFTSYRCHYMQRSPVWHQTPSIVTTTESVQDFGERPTHLSPLQRRHMERFTVKPNPQKLRVISEYEPHEFDFNFLPQPPYEIEIIKVEAKTYKDAILSLPRDCVVINLMDNLDEFGGVCGADAIEQYRRCDLPYTGASVRNFSTKKTNLKQSGVRTPKHLVVKRSDPFHANRFTSQLRFPLLVKPEMDLGASTFIRKEGKVHNIESLQHVVETFPCDSMVVEEFIEGREFTLLAYEQEHKRSVPLVLEPLEICFPPGESFQHERLKWVDEKNLVSKPVAGEDQLVGVLSEVVADTWRILGHDGYFRYDVRVRIPESADAVPTADDVFIVDANPYCGLYYPTDRYDFSDADYILSLSKKSNHLQFTEQLIRLAVRREDRRRKGLMAVEARREQLRNAVADVVAAAASVAKTSAKLQQQQRPKEAKDHKAPEASVSEETLARAKMMNLASSCIRKSAKGAAR